MKIDLIMASKLAKEKEHVYGWLDQNILIIL